MLSSREGAGVRSARKYAIHTSSPLARDSTHSVHPLRSKRGSFSTGHSAHMHGLGGEAREAMLRSGLRVKRTNSLLVEATKGSAVLTGSLVANLPVPDLDIFRRAYGRKECEFAEDSPSALCPFQFVPNDAEDSRWQLPKVQEAVEPNQIVPTQGDETKMDDWFKDMRLKVHTKLVQKQIVASPIESDKTEQGVKKPLSPKASDSKRKPEKPKMELALDAIAPPSPKSPKSPSPKSPSPKSPSHHSQSARSFSRPRLSPKSSNRVAPSNSDFPTSPSSPFPHKKAKKEKYNSLPPIVPNEGRMPKITSHGSSIDVFAAGPLFQPRSESMKARRTYSELDVRRVRSKARNSVGLEPICDPVTAFDDMET